MEFANIFLAILFFMRLLVPRTLVHKILALCKKNDRIVDMGLLSIIDLVVKTYILLSKIKAG